VTPQTVQVDTIRLSVHTGTVTLVPVPDVDEEETIESMMAEIDAESLTPVPRERLSRELGQSMYDSAKIITLLIHVHDFFGGWLTLMVSKLLRR
jgi:hypothetical protein